MTQELVIAQSCNGEDVPAYLDGEMDEIQAAAFERHARECPFCSEQVLEQRQLLRTLDSAFAGEAELPTPRNFEESISIHAQSDMRRVRDRSENHRALLWSGFLGISSVILMGGLRAIGPILSLITSIARYGASLLSLSYRTIKDAATGVAIIVRGFGVRSLFDSSPLEPLVLFFLAVAALLLTYLIRRYHRDGIAWKEAREKAPSA